MRSVARNFRTVSAVIGKRLLVERFALIMPVESARVETRKQPGGSQSFVTLPAFHDSPLSEFLMGTSTVYSFRFGLTLVHHAVRVLGRTATVFTLAFQTELRASILYFFIFFLIVETITVEDFIRDPKLCETSNID